MSLKIYDLDMFESEWIGVAQMDVVRVPGGWIFRAWDNNKDVPRQSVFVPYHEPGELTAVFSRIKGKLHQALEVFSAAHDEDNDQEAIRMTMDEARAIVINEVFPLLGGAE
jgi:hypothetical protein